ncbi:glycine zipper 2TM domain-containing protein [Rhizorhapis sp. SPR117]|uniref:glycine zipper 2TM domain-containing protein n=1 Tax=Rhizorhapis sp. SPR117 TaxID=2912611 RepID=UPI001F0101D4|nr:glycine zipper 2TM domain-containing protein [Rhizorhapis sp. SPR117]
MRNHLMAVTAAAALSLTGCANGGLFGDNDRYDRRYSENGYVLRDNDTIYRDANGNYYCKKPDGTTGLIVGGVAGGVLGNIIAPGGSKTLGTILGAAGGALAGRAIDRNNIRCE